MSKTERFLKDVVDEIAASAIYGNIYSSEIKDRDVIIIFWSGSRFKVSFEELESTVAHDYKDGKEMSREDFIEKYGDD